VLATLKEESCIPVGCDRRRKNGTNLAGCERFSFLPFYRWRSRIESPHAYDQPFEDGVPALSDAVAGDEFLRMGPAENKWTMMAYQPLAQSLSATRPAASDPKALFSLMP
jgi:hypothetical protein